MNIINELFDAPAEWQWSHTGNNQARAKFKIDNQNYEFHANKSYFNWSIDFANMSVAPGKQFDVTNTGNSSIVFATVIDILKDFKKIYAPTEIVFIADDEGAPNRSRLYKRIAKTVFPEYNVSDNGTYIIINLKKDISESEINPADVKEIFKGAADLRNTPGFKGQLANKIPGLRKDKIDINDLQQAWKDAGYPDDTRDIATILKKKFGFGDKEIQKVFSQVFGDSGDNYQQPVASPAIQKIADYAKKTGISGQLIEFMKDEFGEELGIVKTQGKFGKVWNAGKKLYKQAMAEEVRQIFTAILQEERSDRYELIKQQDQTRLGRTRK